MDWQFPVLPTRTISSAERTLVLDNFRGRYICRVQNNKCGNHAYPGQVSFPGRASWSGQFRGRYMGSRTVSLQYVLSKTFPCRHCTVILLMTNSVAGISCVGQFLWHMYYLQDNFRDDTTFQNNFHADIHILSVQFP